MINLVGYLRSISFGGLLGAGIGLYLIKQYPDIFPPNTSPADALAVGTIIGAAIHRAFDAWIVKPILHPLYRFVGFYTDLIHLVLLEKVIGKDAQQEIIQELIRRYFLGEYERGEYLSLLKKKDTESKKHFEKNDNN